MPLKYFIVFVFILIVTNNNSFAQNCPPNINFEYGNYSHWEFYTGSCCPISTSNISGPVIGRHDLQNGTAVDPYGGFPVVPGGSGNYTLKLGNDFSGKQAERARYYVHVPVSNSSYILVFRYAVVFQDPGHGPADQPRFQVSAYDSATGTLIPCSDVTYVASSSLPGFKNSAITPPNGGLVRYKDWDSASIFLGPEVAGKTVAVDFATGDCALGAHFGYAYIDMNCDLFQTYYSIACKPGNNVKLDGPPGYQKYEWMDSAMTKVIASGSPYIANVPDTTTIFALKLTPYSGFGCIDTLMFKIANLSVRTPPDTTLCLYGDTAYFQMNANIKGDAVPISYQWSPATDLSCTNCANPIVTIASDKKYYITVKDSNNCVKQDSISLSVAPAVSANIILPADTICQYEHITLSDTIQNSTKVNHYWETDTGLVHKGASTNIIEVSWQKPGLKSVVLRVSNGFCDYYDSVKIFVKPTPKSSFEVKHNVCIDEMVRIYPKEYDSTIYYWTIDDNPIDDTAYNEYYDITWNAAGKKSVKLVMRAFNGCSTSYDTIIRVHDYPLGKIILDNPNICIGDTIRLRTEPGQYYTYEWSPQNFFTSNNREDVLAVLSYPTHISLKVTTEWGCNTTDSLYIGSERCCKLILPTAFAPTGYGRNNKFRIISQGIYTIHSFMIADRLGNVVHNATDNSGWDGYYNGELQPMATYFYYIKYICASGEVQEAKGDFILVR